MLGDGRLGKWEFLNKVAAAGFAFFLKNADQCDARRVGECMGKVGERGVLGGKEFCFLVGHVMDRRV